MTPTRPTLRTNLELRIGQQPVRNKILLGLSNTKCGEFFAKLEHVKLPLRSVLNESGEAIKYGFFLNSGLASVLSVLMDGKIVEVGLSGFEGFVGLPLTANLHTSHTRTLMQVPGDAFRIKAADLTAALRNCSNLSSNLLRYGQLMTMQASQVGACNRMHSVDERLARWLLMSQDRLGGDIVPLTQEFLAHMLGTRRASVTVAAGVLQSSGLITYTRGVVTIKDRAGLETASCECYCAMVQQTNKWRSEGA
jgi:CRP-like cAMP-binding protein